MENSESSFSDGWTETTTSLARYAIRATARSQSGVRARRRCGAPEKKIVLRTSLSSGGDGAHGCNGAEQWASRARRRGEWERERGVMLLKGSAAIEMQRGQPRSLTTFFREAGLC